MARRWTDEDLQVSVANGHCISDVVRSLGLSITAAGNWKTVQNHIHRLGLDTSHFDVSKSVGNARRHARSWTQVPISMLLVYGSAISSSRLKKRLVEEGLKEHRCESCGLSEWMGEQIPVELDHENGDNQDNRIENLRVLCCNCHALTPTWRGRNVGKSAGSIPTSHRGKVSHDACECGKMKTVGASHCYDCYRVSASSRYPSPEVLIAEFDRHGVSTLSKKYGVSERSVYRALGKARLVSGGGTTVD